MILSRRGKDICSFAPRIQRALDGGARLKFKDDDDLCDPWTQWRPKRSSDAVPPWTAIAIVPPRRTMVAAVGRRAAAAVAPTATAAVA